MRTLILNGSPRPHGDTAALIDALCAGLEGGTELFRAYDGDFHACIDCRRCWREPGCVFDDEWQAILQGLDAYDAIVVATPVYFSQPTGMLLAAGSRLQQLYAAYAFRGEAKKPPTRRGGVLFARGGDGSHLPALDTARVMLRLMGAAYCGMAMAAHTNALPAREDAQAMAQARALAQMLTVRP